MNLGELIKTYRLENGLSQRQFAILCGLSNGYISMLENGKNPSTNEPITPTLTQLQKIAVGMQLPLMDLLSVIDDMPVDIPRNYNDPAVDDEVEEEYLLASRSKDGKQAVRRLTKKQYEIAKSVIESLELNEDENL